MPKSKFLPIVAGAAALGVFCLGSPVAHAVIYNITSDHCSAPAEGCIPANFTSGGTVEVTQVADIGGVDTVQIDVKLTNPPLAGFASTGAGSENLFLFQLNPTTFPTITLTGVTPTVLTPTSVTESAGTIHANGTGDWDYGVACANVVGANCTGGNAGIGTELKFDVTADLITPTSFLLSTGGNGGQLFAIDVIGTNGGTGLVDVPAPAIGHGLLVLLAIGGVLSGSKLLENAKKHRLHAA